MGGENQTGTVAQWHSGTVANKWSKLMNLMNHFKSHKILDRLRLF